MALTRKLLKSFGLEESVIDSIIEAHAESIDHWKGQYEEAKKTADGIAAVEKERDDLKKQVEDLQKTGGDAAKIQQEFDDYKSGIEAEKKTARLRTAMDALLENDVGIKRPSARKLILDAMKLDTYELGEDEQFKDKETIVSSMKQQHADFIGQLQTGGVPPTNPPSGGNKDPEDAFEKGFDM